MSTEKRYFLVEVMLSKDRGDGVPGIGAVAVYLVGGGGPMKKMDAGHGPDEMVDLFKKVQKTLELFGAPFRRRTFSTATDGKRYTSCSKPFEVASTRKVEREYVA